MLGADVVVVLSDGLVLRQSEDAFAGWVAAIEPPSRASRREHPRFREDGCHARGGSEARRQRGSERRRDGYLDPPPERLRVDRKLVPDPVERRRPMKAQRDRKMLGADVRVATLNRFLARE